MAFYTVYLVALFNLFDLSELPPGQTSQTHNVQKIFVQTHRNEGCIALEMLKYPKRLSAKYFRIIKLKKGTEKQM